MNNSDSNWWRGAVIYQIYPRSFMDSNGDGIGDINGIIQRLEYIASLNVDAIWLSPFFTSPMNDFGYDISNYNDVDPMFGTLQDFKNLLGRAHGLNLKVIIDQVYSHCSDQHDWFQESRKDKTNDKADWFVWADAKADGTPPNNWLSLFGGSAWQWDSSRKQYFLHNFLNSQPDLNFHNVRVQDAVLDVAKFWLDLGVDGFRLDVVNMYFHDSALADNPIAQSPEQIFVGVDLANPFCRQYHIKQMCRDDNLGFLKRLRNTMNKYPGSTTVGEIGAPDGMSYMAQYTSGGDKLHMAYTFELLGENCEPTFLRDTLQRVENKLADGWPSFALSNHDVVRSATRWTKGCNNPHEKIKTMLSLLLTQRGSPCIYQGEELGLPEADVAFEDMQDPFGLEFWPDFNGRDGCRTPMAWDNETNLGFSTVKKAWLPYSVDHKALAATVQQNENRSVLHYVTDFLAWRRHHSCLIDGDIQWLDSDTDCLLYRRSSANESLIVAVNLTDKELNVTAMLPLKLVWGQQSDIGKLASYQCLIWSDE